jgi:sodium/bile acid cotransporter 7
MSGYKFLPDLFTTLLIGVVLLASFFPCRGATADFFGQLTYFAIMLLFFMHGAKLTRANVIAGATHWRLHLLVFASTFVMFPLAGLLLRPLFLLFISPDWYTGMLYLCILPATVQSAIAFTSIGRGNVSAAVFSASMSSIIGIVLTPLLAHWILHLESSGQSSLWASIWKIVEQLFLPFVAGQIAHTWIGGWVARHRKILGWVDQSSVLLVVFTAFSAAVTHGLWQRVSPLALLGLIFCCGILLALALWFTWFTARKFGFDREDEVTIVFCGSKKSLASGVPMANVLFGSATAGVLILPLMVFHQIQLMVCSVLARRYGKLAERHERLRENAEKLAD